MSWLSSIFKKPKPNLTPDVQQPSQEDLYHTPKLREVVSRRLGGQDLGFGDDFVSRQSSPGIAQIDANFRERTLPTLSNEASRRGIARSSIATDQIGRADQQRNRDIQETVARFQYLNELQKKQDYGQALDLGQNMQNQQAGLLANRASASERLANATAAQQNAREAENQAKFGLFADVGLPLASSLAPALGGGIGALLQKAGLGNVASMLSPVGESISKGLVQANVQSTDSDSGDLLELLSEAKKRGINLKDLI